jgi:hypothetical protein
MSPSFRNLQIWRHLVAMVVTSVSVAKSAAAAPEADAKAPVAPAAAAAPEVRPAEPTADDVTVDAEPTPGEAPAGRAPPAPSSSAPVPQVPPTGTARAPEVPPPALQQPAAVVAPAAAAPAVPAKPAEAQGHAASGVAGSGYVLSGYFQGQYESHQDSIDQLRQGGALLNQDRFVLRRGRIRVARDWDYASLLVELDGNTVRGPTMRFQKAELSLVYGRSKEKDTPPIAQLTLGQFDAPFGFDLVQSPRTRWFMERSTASRALWPGEPDVGARLSGGIGFARYAFAVTNGEPIDEKSGLGLQDPNGVKDVTGRLGAEAKPSEALVITGGVSFNRGKGFHAGTDATKSSLTWIDNGDGLVQSNELTGIPGAAATPSENFARWAVGADLQIRLKSMLGWSMLYGEVISANNLDRGLFIADPTLVGYDVRELGYYVAFTQEVTQYGVVGIRYDSYDPNSDSTDPRGGKLLPASQKVRTVSPLVGLTLPDRARLVLQYDKIQDLFARDARGVPVDFSNNQWTLRLQVAL